MLIIFPGGPRGDLVLRRSAHLVKVLDDREKMIHQTTDDQRSATKGFDDAEDEYRDGLRSARVEAEEIREGGAYRRPLGSRGPEERGDRRGGRPSSGTDRRPAESPVRGRRGRPR